MDLIIMHLTTIIASYLIGSISFAVVVSHCMSLPDPHSYGSGNPGATNVLRTGNKWAALLTLLGDALKGFVALMLARWIVQAQVDDWVLPWVAVAAFLGHLFPVFHGFKGGKGVATALGVVLAISPMLALLLVLVWVVVFLLTKYSSLAAIISALALPIYVWSWLEAYQDYELVFIFISAMLIWRHRSNIQKLLNGTEAGFGKKKS